jgi:hypothetical protein
MEFSTEYIFWPNGDNSPQKKKKKTKKTDLDM